MLPLAYLEIKEFRDLDEQMASFLIAATALILSSWALMKLRKWLAILAGVAALFSALMILAEVHSTISWHFPNTSERLEPMYTIVGYASAILPVVAIFALLLVVKKRPNQSPQNYAGKEPFRAEGL
jgi:hypothetical protein